MSLPGMAKAQRTIRVLALAVGVLWLASMGCTALVAAHRTGARHEIPERIIGETVLHSFELTEFADQAVTVRHWTHTIGYSANESIQIDVDGSRRLLAPLSDNLFGTNEQITSPLVTEVSSVDGQRTAVITSSGGTADYFWLEIQIRDSRSRTPRQLYPPLRMNLRCPLMVDMQGSYAVVMDVQNSSPRTIPAMLVLSSTGLVVPQRQISPEIAPLASTSVRWDVQVNPSSLAPGNFTDIEVLGVSEGFGLKGIVRKVCTIGLPIQAVIPGMTLEMAAMIGIILIVVGAITNHTWLASTLTARLSRLRKYQPSWILAFVLFVLGIIMWQFGKYLLPLGYYYVFVPNDTIPLLK